MKILITGADGQVAWDLIQAANQKKIDCIALTQNQLDITQPDAIESTFDAYQPTLVINPAAYTAVDKAEKEFQEAFRVNYDGARILANQCEHQHIPLIHLSTDYVFDGTKKAGYLETDKPNPLNQYGKSKLKGEQAVHNNLAEHIILRVSGVFGFHGNNFVKTILRLASEREELRIVDDQITCPTPASEIANTLLTLAEMVQSNPCWGTYHYCSSKPTSWYHFAESIITYAKEYKPLLVKKLTAITTKEFPTPAKRPQNSVLNCEKIQYTFGIKPCHWEKSLHTLIKELLT